MAKKKISEKYLPWIDARERYTLSYAHIRMARELGLNPKKFQQPGEHQAGAMGVALKKSRPENARYI